MNKIGTLVRGGAFSVNRITVVFVLAAMLLALSAGVAVAANITGTNGNDFLRGTDQVDKIKGLAGADELEGRDGGDTLLGGTGGDTILGEKGGDEIQGESGEDKLRGGEGNDTLRAGNDERTDFVFCGSGDDDTAHIQLNDLVDGEVSGESLLDGVGIVTSCENIFVQGIPIPPLPLP